MKKPSLQKIEQCNWWPLPDGDRCDLDGTEFYHERNLYFCPEHYSEQLNFDYADVEVSRWPLT